MENADHWAPPQVDMEANLNKVQEETLMSIVQKRFTTASQARRVHEERMVDSYNNFRGIYGKNVAFRKSEKSRVFVKITKTKVLAAYGHLIDIILGGERFPIEVGPTKVPEGVDEVAHVGTPDEMQAKAADQQEPQAEDPFDVGHPEDGRELKPGATYGSGLWNKLFPKRGTEALEQAVLVPGPSPDPKIPKKSPADLAGEKMDKLIRDQLEESNSSTALSKAAFEAVMLGTGVIKGPFTYRKTLHKWTKDEDGKRVYTPIVTKVPRVEFVSVWDIYPDPNATCKEEMSYLIHRHRLNESQMRSLINLPLFKKEQILKCLEDGFNYQKQIYEDSIHPSNEEGTGKQYDDRFEVLEYWGTMGAKEASEMGIDIGDSDELSEIQINAWVCGGNLLRLSINPFKPTRIPYHIFNYEVNPYSIFGIGVPENMADSQQIMNGHVRMAIDNLALAGGLVFDVDETALVPGQSMEIFNGKIFYRQSGQPGQSVYGIKFPNTANENLSMFDRFRQVSDEETGIPSYSHGQTGVQGLTRTASGMSMLMGAASLNIKTVIKNVDMQLLEPLGKDMFQWNMQYHEGDLPIEGDLEVRALGTKSLMQKEVRSQRLNVFLQTVLNPTIAPWANIPYIIEELAKTLDLDKEKVLNSTEEARVAAMIIGLQNAARQESGAQAPGSNQEPGGMGSPDGVMGPVGAQGTTGNGDGTIGTGMAAMPGESEFSASA